MNDDFDNERTDRAALERARRIVIPPEDPEEVRKRDEAHWNEIDVGETKEDDDDEEL